MKNNKGNKNPFCSQYGSIDKSSQYIRIAILSLLVFAFTGCRKFLEIPPPSANINEANIYQTDQTAISTLNAIYLKLSDNNQHQFTAPATLMATSFLGGLLSDELTLYSLNADVDQSYYFQNNLTPIQPSSTPWTDIYGILFKANAAYEGIIASNNLSTKVKSQLEGEALFLRAFCYFYLVNYYGDVPLALTTDYKRNSMLARSSKTEIYNQMIEDLEKAKDLLSADYMGGDLKSVTEERVRPNKWTAIALLARIYLFSGRYSDAAEAASQVISQSVLYDVEGVDLNDVFKKNSRETLWALQTVGDGNLSNTGDGLTFILTSVGPQSGGDPRNPVYLSPFLMAAFEPGDERKLKWTDTVTVGGITYPYAYKYKIGYTPVDAQEYTIILRIAEQYLIRAEARTELDDITGAQEDLNVVRNRSGLPNTIAITQSDLFNAILHERQVELFTEWGHRWFDLARSQRINEVMLDVTTAKGGSWSDYKRLLPIPQSEIDADPNLQGHQNAGY